MEQQRLLLIIALAIVSYLLWDAWQLDYGPRPVVPVSQQAPTATAAGEGTGTTTSGEVPTASEVPASDAATQAGAVPANQEFLGSAQRIRVVTDVVNAEIDSKGGDLRVLKLLQYPVKVTTPDDPFQLFNDRLPLLYVAQSGFANKRPQPEVLSAAPNHLVEYQAEQSEYQLAPGADSLDVRMHWTSPEGVRFTKIYTFHRGTYVIDIRHAVHNPTGRPWRGTPYYQLQRTDAESGETSRFLVTYLGGAIFSPDKKYEEIDFSDIEEQAYHREITGGWAAFVQHYFLGAFIPEPDHAFIYFTRVLKSSSIPASRYFVGMQAAQELQVAAGSEGQVHNRIFAGPKLQNLLEEIAPGLDLTVDYSWLTVLAKPLFWLLDVFHGWVGNWGWAIIMLTILIKAVFYKLSETSYKSMARMKIVAPRMQQLKERYGSDKQKFQQALMEMYKKEKVNPLGGCLPILVQIPVFIALYWVLLESVELRQAPWILWIRDMSSPDPYFVLPLLFGISMFIQQKLNPAPPDPMQAKMMMALPFVFTIFFAFFPAGLVLYWVVNNTLSIAQQWYITSVVMEKGSKA